MNQTPSGYEEEIINFDSEYKLVVQRNNLNSRAIVDLKVSNSEGVCYSS